MKGTRPLNNEELTLISNSFEGLYAIRDRSLILIGISTGGRISELLSLKIGDVWQNKKPVENLHFNRNVVKGKENARSVPVNSDGIGAIKELIAWHKEKYGSLDTMRPLFPSRQSRKGKGISAVTRQRAHQIFKDVCHKAGLNGNLATHSLRKSYAQRLYAILADIFSVKEMLGHQNVTTTQAYLGVDIEKVKEASEAMALHRQNKS